MKEMSHKERVLITINLEEPDRVPIDLMSSPTGIADGAYFKLRDYLEIGGDISPYRRGRTSNYYDERVLEALDVDFRHVWLKGQGGFSLEANGNGTYTDGWGITYKCTGPFLGIISHPLANTSLESLENYCWPDPYSLGRIGGLEERAKKLHEEGKFAIVAKDVVSGGPLEYGCWLRGTEQFMIDMVANKQFARELITRVESVILGLWEVFLDAVGEYVDIVQTSEDLGSQSSLLISPQLYREMLKPTRVRINNLIKSLAPHAKVFYHSCGAIYELIPDIIETGVDILNPVQPRAFGMDPARLKKEFGSRLCFHGGIDVQQTLPHGSPRDVEYEVRERIGQLGKGGGYIVAPANVIQNDIPPANIVSMCEAVRKWGKYPLDVDELERKVNCEYT